MQKKKFKIWGIVFIVFLIIPVISFGKEIVEREKQNDARGEIRTQINELKGTVQDFFNQKEKTKEEQKKKVEEVQPQKKLADDSDMRKGSFCFQIPTYAMRVEEEVAKREANLMVKIEEKKIQTEKRVALVDEKRIDRRTDWDESRLKSIEKIAGRAKTEQEKKALEIFRQTIASAIAERRRALDVATNNFRIDILRVGETRQEQIADAVKKYHTTLDTIVTETKNDCGNTASDMKTNRTTFQIRMQNAKDVFQQDQKNIEKNSQSLTSLVDEQKATLVKINSDFQAKIQRALQNLKKEFPSA